MKIGIQTGEKDVNRLIEYCQQLDVDQVCLSCSSISGYVEKGYLDSQDLKSFKQPLDDAGMNLAVLIPNRPPAETLLGKPEGEEDLSKLLKTIEAMGVGFVETLLLYTMLEKSGDSKQATDDWNRMIEFYKKIAQQAEKCNVKIATHCMYQENCLLRGVEDIKRLMEDVPSNCNGITYCPGLHIWSEDDIYEVIAQLADKIFFVHARDQSGRGDSFVEVFLGEGETDTPRVIGLLKEAEYGCVICPEHLGESKTPGEDLQAKAVEYLRKLAAST